MSPIAFQNVGRNGDTNRARWPDSALWEIITRELREDLFEMRNFSHPDTIKRVHKEAHLRLLMSQCTGLLITRAAIAGVQVAELASFTLSEAKDLAAEFSAEPERFEAKLQESAARYEAMS